MNGDAAIVRNLLGALSPQRQPALIWVCLAHLLLVFVLFDPKPFLGGDNYWYMLLGEALREGQGYRDLWLPEAPPHTRYPPLYPSLLAGLGFITSSVIFFKLLSVAFTTGIVALVYLLAQRRSGNRQLALFAALLIACSPVLVEYGHWVLSEPAFVFFVALALWAFTRDSEGADRRFFAVGTGASILAALTRSAGYPLLLAALLALAMRRRWKDASIYAGTTLLFVGGWSLRNRLVGASDVPYSQWLLYRNPYQPELGTISLPELVPRFLLNFEEYALLVLPQSIAGRDLVGAFATLLGVVLILAVLVGLALRIRKLEVPELFLIFYAGLILLWPEPWSDQRLLLPLLPLIAVLIMEAGHWALREKGWAGGAGSLAMFVVGTVLVGLAAFGNMRIMPPAIDCNREYWKGNRFACYPPPLGDFINVATWAGENTRSEAIVVNRKPQIFYWYGRRRGDVYPFTENSDSLLRFVDSQEADYVLVDMWSATTFQYLIPAVQENLQRFGVVHQEGDPPSFLLELRPAVDR